MIFGSIGLLVVAGGLLAAGISESSTGFLVASFVCTVVAGALLLLASAIARAARGGGLAPFGGPTATAGGGVIYVPVAQAPGTLAPMVAVAGGNGDAPEATAGSPPVLGYEAMTAEQVVRLIGSGALSDDQLAAIRQYEAAGQARKTVLDRLDKALKKGARASR